ncbi:MAG: RDD family protein [Rhizobiaceae bacterium]|nr:RDD family protein [Rhizobiaceae bacterium]MCZ8351195.1 RDD family protein [Rhizobium sp.]
MSWFYVLDGQQLGPATANELRSLIKSGHISASTLVWTHGLENWRPFNRVELPRNDGSKPPILPATPGKPALPPLPADAIPLNLNSVVSKPWPRFWARLIDNIIFIWVISACVLYSSSLYMPELHNYLITMNRFLFGIVIFPAVPLVLGILQATTGTTPGKALMGVKVPLPPGWNRFSFYIAREFVVWVQGLAAGLPIIVLFTQYRQYRLLVSTGATSYDAGNPTIISNPSWPRFALGIVTAFAVVTGQNMIQNILASAERERQAVETTEQLDAPVSKERQATRRWANPVTQEIASFSGAWEPSELKTNSGRAFHFVSTMLPAEVVFAHEDIPEEVSLRDYGDAIAVLISDTIRLEGTWSETSLNGQPAVRRTGKAVNTPDAKVTILVTRRGDTVWRALTITRGSKSETRRSATSLRDSLLETID